MLLGTLGCMYLFKLVFSVFLDVYPGVELLGHKVVLVLVFEKWPYYFPQWRHQFTFPPTVYEGSLFFTSSPTFVICVCVCVLMIAILTDVGWYLIVVLICISLMMATLRIFSCMCWTHVCLLWKIIQIFCPYLIRLVFDIELHELFTHFGY